MTRRLHWPAGRLRSGPWSVELTPAVAGWALTSLRVVDLDAGGRQTIDTGDDEWLVLPLAGAGTVVVGERRIELLGRASVWDGPSDFVYLPRRTRATLVSPLGGRFACASAPSSVDLPVRRVAAAEVAVELRGAGRCSRQVHNFCTPGVFDAGRLIACEVITPAGNWSSYPPHKHDEDRAGESELEEIYYFEVGDGPGGAGVAYQRAYGTERRPFDFLAEVRGGDVVAIPYGWHGPSMAAPGYDLYYLNVMAGPGVRAWLICDDPAHAWVRATWADEDVDPRLPIGVDVRTAT